MLHMGEIRIPHSLATGQNAGSVSKVRRHKHLVASTVYGVKAAASVSQYATRDDNLHTTRTNV